MPLTSTWELFKKYFAAEITRLDDSKIKQMWSSSKARTLLYEDELLEQVASKMGLIFVCEEFKIDYTFCKVMPDQYKVPLVYVESENVALDSVHEMRKLCCLSAPLKVLITCVAWSKEPGYWPNGGYQDVLIERWGRIIRSHNAVWPQPSVTGVVIAEGRDTVFRFYSIVFGPNGELLGTEELLHERVIEETVAG